MNSQLETLQNELAGDEPQLQSLLQGLQRLDRYARRMKLLDGQDSMLEHLAVGTKQVSDAETDEEQAKDERHGLTTALAEMLDKLEQHVDLVTQAMNRWCLSVLAWEFGVLLVLIGGVTGIAAVIGNGQPLFVMQGWWGELLMRPVSLSVYSLLLLLGLGIMHFKLRKRFAVRIADRLNQEEPFDTQRAFLKNTRIWHSIYRPVPVGWAGRAKQQVTELRKQLTDTVVHPESTSLH